MTDEGNIPEKSPKKQDIGTFTVFLGYLQSVKNGLKWRFLNNG